MNDSLTFTLRSLESFSKSYQRLGIKQCQLVEITWCQVVVMKFKKKIFVIKKQNS